jgi:membrane-associated phospholipid phosphatase
MDASAVARWRVLCLLMLGAFLGLSGVVYAVGLLPGDVALHGEILEARGGLAHAAARWLNYGGKWVVLAPAMLAVFAWSRAARRHWWLWCALMPVGGAVEQLFKFLVGRPRPRGFHWGFPSGHVTAATTFAVLLLYMLSREPVSPRARVTLIVLAAVLVGTVGYARVILNAHWPSDVLGGVLLGGGCAAAGAWWDSVHGEKPAETPRPADDVIRARG